ncbi:hypothetical protein BHE74_00027327 [Ensete ventricosum]|nr:hypothetical protein BHE74_00027327 [Ensete ventricosum]
MHSMAFPTNKRVISGAIPIGGVGEAAEAGLPPWQGRIPAMSAPFLPSSNWPSAVLLLFPDRKTHVDFLVELIDTVVQGTFDCTRAKRGPPAPAATIGCPVDPTRRGAVNGQLRHDHGRRSGAVLAGVVRRESFLEQGAGPGHTVTLVPRGSTGLGWVQ